MFSTFDRWLHFALQEALDELTLKQNEALLDNNRELRNYAVLKMDYEVEVLQQQRVSRRLVIKEDEVKSLLVKLYVSQRYEHSYFTSGYKWPEMTL